MEKLIQEKMQLIESQIKNILPNLDLNTIEYSINPIIKINSKIASDMLTKNISNRKINRQRVEFYAKEMQKDGWRLNGENLKFDINGNLIDGQHRLSAIQTLTDKSVSIELRLGINENDFATIDTGRSRTFGDVLSILKIPYHQIIAAAIKSLYLYDNKYISLISGVRTSNLTNHGSIKFGNKNPSNQTLENYFYDNICISNYLITTKAASKISSCAELTFLNYVYSRIDEDLAKEFMRALINGENLQNDDVMLILRNKLIDARLSKGLGFSPRHRISLINKVWNYWRSGKFKMKILKYKEIEEGFIYAI